MSSRVREHSLESIQRLESFVSEHSGVREFDRRVGWRGGLESI